MSCHHDDILQVLDLRGNGTVLTTVGGDGYHVGCDWSRYKDKTFNFFGSDRSPRSQDVRVCVRPCVRLCDIMLTSTQEEFLRVLEGLK